MNKGLLHFANFLFRPSCSLRSAQIERFVLLMNPLPVCHVFEDEKSDGSDEKSIKRKFAHKYCRTKISATNFV